LLLLQRLCLRTPQLLRLGAQGADIGMRAGTRRAVATPRMLPGLEGSLCSSRACANTHTHTHTPLPLLRPAHVLRPGGPVLRCAQPPTSCCGAALPPGAHAGPHFPATRGRDVGKQPGQRPLWDTHGVGSRQALPAQHNADTHLHGCRCSVAHGLQGRLGRRCPARGVPPGVGCLCSRLLSRAQACQQRLLLLRCCRLLRRCLVGQCADLAHERAAGIARV
jgi:hypothetical protein